VTYPAGTLFNTACNCCQDSSLHAIDVATCSSSPPAPTAAQHRKLLSADASTAQPAVAQTLQQPRPAAAALVAGSTADDATIIYTAATGTATDSNGQVVRLPPNRPASPAFGTWNSYGKQYTTGPYAGSKIVKEPAVNGPRHTVSTQPSSSRGAVNSEIGSRTALAAAKPSVFAEDDTTSRRSLLSVQHISHTSRDLAMKRTPPKVTATATSTAGSVAEVMAAAADAPLQAIRATAARALGPEDELNVPFTTKAVPTASAAAASSSNQLSRRRARLVHATSMGSRAPEIIEVGQLTGPEADAARREAAAAPPVQVNPTIVPLPGYMTGDTHPMEAPYHRKRGGKTHTHGKKGHKVSKARHGGSRHTGPHKSDYQYEENVKVAAMQQLLQSSSSSSVRPSLRLQ